VAPAEKGDKGAPQKKKPSTTQDLFKSWNFDNQAAGDTPNGFSPYTIGAGLAGLWKIQPDASAPTAPNIVMQSAPCPVEGCYQVLLVDGLIYDYPDVAIRLRLTGEQVVGSNAGGGLVLGARDPQNFYAVVVAQAGDTVEMLRVLEGKAAVLGRTILKSRKIAWHLLRVRRNTIISKEYLEVAVDGEIVLSVEDKTLGAGQVGLVTRGDAMLAFDNLHAAPLYSQTPLSPPAAY
jgi:hypothetical protein